MIIMKYKKKPVIIDANDSAFLRALNRVCEAFLSSGKWKGTKGVVTFASSSDGYIVLPRQYEPAD